MVVLCKTCGALKDSSEFHRDRSKAAGHVSSCKVCKCARSRSWNSENRQRHAEYLSRHRREVPDLIRATTRKWREEHPVETKAHWIVSNAIRDGRLVRQSCLVCGKTKTVAHHEDYTQPLAVIWYCHKHHHERHKRVSAGGIPAGSH